MATTTPELTRAEKVARYIELDAIGNILITYNNEVAEFFKVIDLTNEATLTGGLYSELWPEDEDLETDEHNLAEARSHLLAADVLDYLADYGRELAREQRKGAVGHLAEVGKAPDA